MKKLGKLIPAILLAVGILASLPVAASAASVVGTISGEGRATMTDLPTVPPGMNISTFAVEATLFSNGSARGDFWCIDVIGDVPGYPGRVWGDITSWSRNPADGSVSLHVTGKFVAFPVVGDPTPVSFTVTIQHFGGAGVGHWTLDGPGFVSPYNGGPICQELLNRGKIVAHWK